MANLKYLNAINYLVEAKVNALSNIYKAFNGDWERAWHSNLSQYIPKDKDKDGKRISADYKAKQKSIDPDKQWDLVKKYGIDIITIHDKKYPRSLKAIAQQPFLLYIRGSIDLLNKKGIAVVGTRKITPYGKNVTPELIIPLIHAGLPIYSGLAYGVDSLAHQTTLDSGGQTVAVLANSLDDRSIHPRTHLNLAHSILKHGGTLVSEYAPIYTAHPYSFPQRNRIISGLSRGVLVIEGDIKSGTMITAKMAVDQNRDVFAVPGTIYSQMSSGTNWLIKKGAKLVTNAEDILEEYGLESKVFVKDEFTSDEKNQKSKIHPDNEQQVKILNTLETENKTLDKIIQDTGLEVQVVNSTVMIMEIQGKIKELGNKKYCIRY